MAGHYVDQASVSPRLQVNLKRGWIQTPPVFLSQLLPSAAATCLVSLLGFYRGQCTPSELRK